MRKRPESFAIALEALRGELRAGAHASGARLTALEIAGRLHLSATPVREALSRLAGDGLLDDRRGQGYFAVQLSAREIQQLFRLQHAVLNIACADTRPQTRSALERLESAVIETRGSEAFQLGSERLFLFLSASASPALARHLRRLQDQLAPARRMEPYVLPDLEVELTNLLDAVRADSSAPLEAALNAFHARRIAASETLAQTQSIIRI